MFNATPLTLLLIALSEKNLTSENVPSTTRHKPKVFISQI